VSAGPAIPTGLTGQSEVTGDLRVECGAVIVGSGAGGATMAAELTDAGIDVVMVEEGGYHPTQSFTAEAGRALRTLYRDGGAVQTPALLARSGLKSRSGQLGRNLSLHPNAKVIAFFDEEVTGWHGVHQAFQVREFMNEGILMTAGLPSSKPASATRNAPVQEPAILAPAACHLVSHGTQRRFSANDLARSSSRPGTTTRSGAVISAATADG
jgi:glycine/D-amino acid oxidase-like deaminating enzyme